MAIISTPAIVLKAFDFRETSKIAVFFTENQGKVSGVLKGIRTNPKKFGSSLERFSVNDIVYYPYRNSDIHLVSQCDMRSFFYPIRQDLKKSTAATYASELINLMMPTELENKRIYQLMIDFLDELQECHDVDRLIRVLQIKMLYFSGFRPHLDACVHCQKKVHGKASFSMNEGGLVCVKCHSRVDEPYPISPGTVETILHVERSSWKNCQRVKLTKISSQELKYILNNFLVFHLGRKIKSAKYL